MHSENETFNFPVGSNPPVRDIFKLSQLEGLFLSAYQPRVVEPIYTY